jgi:protocatechuate 3,4-dioxygenase beta subunit
MLDRRKLLKGVGSFIALVPVACSASNNGASSGSATNGAGGSGGMCALTPQQTEGPFYLSEELLREAIAEGKAGVPLVVRIQLVQLPDCTPLTDAPVDIWHADHQGWYSGFLEQGNLKDVDTRGETFLRGTRSSDADGVVSFRTVYPGWYPGRAIHIHFKVRLAGDMEVTSQLYLPDTVNEAVHAQLPYSDHGPVPASNGQDGLFDKTADHDSLIAEVTADGAGYRAELVVGVV